MAHNDTVSAPYPVSRQNSALASHVGDLPDEILDSVFQHAALAYGNDHPIRATLRRVCRRWDAVVLGNPELWTRINIGISLAAISEPEPAGASSETRTRNNGANDTKRLKVVPPGAWETSNQNRGKVPGFVCGGEGSAGNCRAQTARSTWVRNGLASMPPLNFIRELLTRSGELRISLGMTVCDLDADTVVVRPVHVNEGPPRQKNGNAGSRDDRDKGEDEDVDSTDLVVAPSPYIMTVTNEVENVLLSPMNLQRRLAEYFHGVVQLLTAHIHRCTDFHLYFVSEHTAVAPSIPPKITLPFSYLISTLPLCKGQNLHSVSITSHLIRFTNSHSSTHTANQAIFSSLVCSLPPSVRRLHWQCDTPGIDYTAFAGLKDLTHIDVRGILSSEDVLGILTKAEEAKTIRVHINSPYAGFVNPSSHFLTMKNLEGLTLKSGCEVFQVLGMCVKMPRLGVCCIEVPFQVLKQQWHDPINNASGNIALNGGVAIRDTWEWLRIFLNRCPELKLLQLYDPHGAIPIDMIKDLVSAVKDASACFIVTPGVNWMQRPDVDEAFWERLREMRHPREDDVRVTTLRDKDGKPWVSVGWFVEPYMEEWLRGEEWVQDTGFRWDILDEYCI